MINHHHHPFISFWKFWLPRSERQDEKFERHFTSNIGLTCADNVNVFLQSALWDLLYDCRPYRTHRAYLMRGSFGLQGFDAKTCPRSKARILSQDKGTVCENSKHVEFSHCNPVDGIRSSWAGIQCEGNWNYISATKWSSKLFNMIAAWVFRRGWSW